ncbi:hypothetical protein AAHE18_14G191400 [Arachis hypogaea]
MNKKEKEKENRKLRRSGTKKSMQKRENADGEHKNHLRRRVDRRGAFSWSQRLSGNSIKEMNFSSNDGSNGGGGGDGGRGGDGDGDGYRNARVSVSSHPLFFLFKYFLRF